MDEMLKAMFGEKEKMLMSTMSVTHEHHHEIKGLHALTDALCEYVGLPRKCLAPDGTALKVGDTLYCKGGDTKKVLALGWKWVMLSRTEDAAKPDGRWYEEQIKAHGLSLNPDDVGKTSHDEE